MIGAERLPSPYHVYDGTLTLIGGTVDLAEAVRIAGREGLHPITDDAGRALAALWVGDFRDASLGAHTELQVSLLASTREGVRVRAHDYALFRVFTSLPDVLMICHGLWNNTERVVRYNREHLALNVRLADSVLESMDGVERFRFTDPLSGEVVAEGRLASPPRRQSLRELLRVFSQVSPGGFWRMARAGHLEVAVANTRRTPEEATWVARTCTAPGGQIVRLFGPNDHLTLSTGSFAGLGFSPAFVQVTSGLKFVYLRPVRLDVLRGGE